MRANLVPFFVAILVGLAFNWLAALIVFIACVLVSAAVA